MSSVSLLASVKNSVILVGEEKNRVKRESGGPCLRVSAGPRKERKTMRLCIADAPCKVC